MLEPLQARAGDAQARHVRPFHRRELATLSKCRRMVSRVIGAQESLARKRHAGLFFRGAESLDEGLSRYGCVGSTK